MAGLTFGSKRMQGWGFVRLFVDVWSRSLVGGVSI